MKKIYQLIIGFAISLGIANAQTYLSENFDGTWSGSPAAPAGWTQTQTILLGDGIPEATTANGEKDWEQNTNTGAGTWSNSPGGTMPNAAVSGSNVLFMNDYYFGSTGNAFGSRRMESPAINLASATSPYVRFSYFCGYPSTNLLLRVVASNDGGTTWNPIMFISPNADVTSFSSTTPWQKISVKIPSIFMVSNAKLGLEMTNTWGTSCLFVDNFSVEEFTPTTITSAASGAWSNPATWVGGVVPNANNNVVIAATHTVQTDVNIARMQDLSIDGVFTYSSTSTTQLNHVFGNMTINATGTYFSGNGTTGKRSYFGGNIINNGIMNFQPGTSVTGALVWIGYQSTYSGSGSIVNNRVPTVAHAAIGGVQYSSPFTISNTCALYLGTVNGTNLTLGNAPSTGATFLIEECVGKIVGPVTYNSTNIAQRNLTFTNPVNGQGGISLGIPQSNVTPADEIETIAGNKQVTGTLNMNTHNNMVLGYPLSVGTSTGSQNIALSRGIIITTSVNILTLNQSAAGTIGTVPTTITSDGTNGGNHGSYISGPLKIFFPSTGSGNRTFPLGAGTAFHTNLPSANAKRELVLGSGSLAWNSQTITATIEAPPSGSTTGTLSTVMGNRAYRLNFNGGPNLGINNTLQMAYNNSTFGGNDNLVGTLQDIRIAQSPALSGPWTERSLTSGSGPIVNNTPSTRVTTSVAPGPINSGDQYFAWATVSSICNGAPTSGTITASSTTLCNGSSKTLSLTGATSGVGITYQWQSSTVAGGPYSNMGTSLTQTTGVLSSTMYYIVTTSCSTSGLLSTTPEFTLTVYANPTIALTPTNASICLPGSPSVNLTASGASTYTWSPAASLSSANGSLVSASPSASQIYTVIGTSSVGCNSAPTTVGVTMNIGVTINSISATPNSVCSGGSSTLTPSIPTPTLNYCQPVYSIGTSGGDYVGGVTLSTLSNTTTGLASPYYTVYPQLGNTTTTLTAGTVYTIQLQPGSYSSSNSLAAWIDFNQNGNLADPGEKLGEVTGLGAFPAVGNVTFTVPPTALNGSAQLRVREIYAGLNMDPCANDSYGETEDYIITIMGGVNPVNTYTWAPIANLSSVNTASTVANTITATTIYTLNVTNIYGCITTSNVTVSVTPSPTINVLGNAPICSGSSLTLNASGADTYTWSTTSNSTSIVVAPSTGTVYSVSGTSSLTGCSNSIAVTVTVNPLPSVSLTAAQTTACIGGSTVALTGSPIGGTYTGSNVLGNYFTPASTGTFVLNYAYTNTVTGCSNSATTSIVVSVCTSISKLAQGNATINLFPNPSNGKFVVEMSNANNASVQVLDLTGRILLNTTMNNNALEIDLSNYSNGVYYIRINSNNQLHVLKAIKQ
ncbi:MAG: T9SS type A sorting domain-containing protein [Bacteroidetes bacterium]|nr:T9SS type A sorting domain-containing protein [Bacteroidota bacterium]